jgi:toxin FitB
VIILDTNVVSALMRPNDNPVVLAWLDKQASVSVWTTAITILEIRFGLMLLAFDATAADVAASLAAAYRKRGRQIDFRDIQIAGIALARKATLATRNLKHFDDPSITTINPWQT